MVATSQEMPYASSSSLTVGGTFGMAGQADPGNDQAAVLGNHLETDPVLAGREWLAHDHLLPLDTLSVAQKRRFVDIVQRSLQTFLHAVVIPPTERSPSPARQVRRDLHCWRRWSECSQVIAEPGNREQRERRGQWGDQLSIQVALGDKLGYPSVIENLRPVLGSELSVLEGTGKLPL